MKLNLGCGGDHKKGYVNVDAFDKTTADKIMEATNLKFDDNSIDEILMSQVIEHFGIARSLFVLSECFRVLKPNGKLVLETPDIRKSFQVFLKGEREDRKYILPWIYGVDIPGMQHRFCFPDDLLTEELGKIGYSNVLKSNLEFDKHQPILRVICKKPQKNKSFQLISEFRKILLKSKKIDLDQQINALEKENLIEFFTEEILIFFEKNNEKIFENIFLNGAIKSPEITLLFFKFLIDKKIFNKKNKDTYINILKGLIKINFIEVLVNYSTQIPNLIGKQEKLFDKMCNFGKDTIKKLLKEPSKGQEKIFKELKKIKGLKIEYKEDFLSEKLLMLKANRLFQKAVKSFNLSNYEKAILFFKKSSLIYRDQILTYWNLGRIYMITKNQKNAELNYKNALRILKHIKYDNEKEIETLLTKEKSGKTYEKYKNSLISLRQIYESMWKRIILLHWK